MENNTISVNLNNLTDEEREQLLKLVEKSNEKKNKVWQPKENDNYYYIRSDGLVIYTPYNSSFSGDVNRYKLGNCFKTEEEAEFALKKQKLITEIKRYIAENDPEELDWKNIEQNKFYLCYNHNRCDDNLDVSYNVTARSMNTIYFSGKLDWEKMISDIGEDRIKKYLFEIK